MKISIIVYNLTILNKGLLYPSSPLFEKNSFILF